MTKTCFYCNKEKPDAEFSKEHIVPQAIGGNITPKNPFVSESVCKNCNNAAGFFIDAPFSKSYFINSFRTLNATKYVKLTPSSILPLSYMGTASEIQFEDKICELYLGPTGDRIYHFHVPYPEEPDIPHMVGVPPHLRRKGIDYGFVFLFLRSNNLKWTPTIFYSTIDAFKNSTFYFGNGIVPKVEGATFYEVPLQLKEVHEKLVSLNGKVHAAQVKIGIDFNKRFLAKLALGFGCLHLNDEFKKSSDADLLRKFMWTKNHTEREKIPVRGNVILMENSTQVQELMKIEGAHTFSMQSLGDNLVLYSCFYGQQSSIIQVSSNPVHWKGKIDTGIVYIVFPERQECVGPLLLEEFLGHKCNEYPNGPLSRIESEMKNMEPLPQFMVKEGGIPDEFATS